MQIKVLLPSGEVNIPVEHNQTPGHLKENLKYSLRVPPKLIKLTCEGKELDDIKPLDAEPNCVRDGAVLVAEAREGAPDEAPKEQVKPPQQTIIKKEEPPKPKKIKRDEVRPIVGESDVVKKRVIEPGYQQWKPEQEWLAGKCSKRHMAFLKLEAVEDKKTYPEQEDCALALALGDPHTSPAWTAAAVQMEIGEKAEFSINKKVVDFDPEGLNPTDHSATWTVELVRVVEVEDVQQDFSQLLEIEATGGEERVQELDTVSIHSRIRRWMAEGIFCIKSSRERIAILPGYGLVSIEDPNAPPYAISMGEGSLEYAELIVMRLGPGGVGHLYLKTEALRHNRPQGCVVVDVELCAVDTNRGPGSEGWRGWSSLMLERETGDQWLEEGDGRRKRLETFGTLRKSTADSADAEAHVAEEARKFGRNAARRYRRALRWLESDGQQESRHKMERRTLAMRLAKAVALSHQRFGEAAEAAAGEEDKQALAEAKGLLQEVLDSAEAVECESLQYECLKISLQVCIQAKDLDEARRIVEKLEALKQDDEELKSDKARINKVQDELTKKKGAGTTEDLRDELAALCVKIKDAGGTVEAADKEALLEKMGVLLALMKENKVTYESCTKCKVGKEIGNAMKLGDPDIAKKGREIVAEIQALAKRAALGI